MAAPHRNTNHVTNGLKIRPETIPERIALGVLPKPFKRVENNLRAYRRKLENVVAVHHGDIDLYLASLIHECCAWERHGMLCARWLRDATDLTSDQKVSFSREVARAATERNKVLRALGLDKAGRRGDVWDSLTEPPRSLSKNLNSSGVFGRDALNRCQSGLHFRA